MTHANMRASSKLKDTKNTWQLNVMCEPWLNPGSGGKKAIVDIIGTVGEFEYGLLDNMIILYKSSWCNNDNCGFVREYLSS